jgi:Dyp-type peroxidase family
MADHQSLSVADLQDIQAGPVAAVPTRNSTFLFFAIKDVNKFRTLFRENVLPSITTSDSARRMRDVVVQAKTKNEMASLAGINVSFSQKGLSKLLSNADTKDDAFQQGQLPRATTLGDDTGKWLHQFKDHPIDGLFEVTGYPATHIQNVVREKIKPLRDTAITVIFEHSGQVRPGKEKGHEHFGFNDGISQPFVKFQDDDGQVPKRENLPGQTVVNPGVLVIGQPGDDFLSTRPPWAKNGSFVVYRHLKQLVPEFNDFLKAAVLGSIFDPPSLPGILGGEDFDKRVDFLGARLVGRWKSGLPVVLTPMKDGHFPVDNPSIGNNPQLNNNFDYGPREESPRQQFLCPFAGHTRKTGPRTDLPLAAAETHMIRRGGIAFGPEVSALEKLVTLHDRGLSFVCYQSSLAAGFEFIQKSWANNENFTFNTGAVAPGFDPIISQKPGEARTMSGYNAQDLSKRLPLPTQWVIAQGGEYFFLPSITTLKTISGL